VNPLLERFLAYVKIDTTSSDESGTSPTTGRQFDLLRLLEGELRDMGIPDVTVSDTGVLYAKVPGGKGPETVGLIAHVDTSPDAPGNDVKPRLHEKWDGSPIELPEGVLIDPAQTKDMSRYLGGTIITGDGTTLLGADDKAGVAVIMEVCRKLMEDPGMERPRIVVAFTPDEEVGRGVDNFDTEFFGADFAYTVDGGCLGYIDTQTFNAWKAVWKITGREVHPGSAKGVMVNAGRIAAELVSLLRAEEMPENTDGLEGYFYPLRIEGTTPGAEVRMIVRDFTMDGMEKRLAELEALKELLRARYPGATIELGTCEQYRNPVEILTRDRRPVDYALEGSRRAGVEAEEGSIRGGTDGSRLSYMGLPTVNLPTGGEMYHSRTEWIAVEGLEAAAGILMETLRVWGEHLPD
jgi:tripeptide aminopeptidase